MFSSTKKEGLSITFPDVCITPVSPGSSSPVPYPTIAKTALASQMQTAQKVPVSGSTSPTAGAIAMKAEIQQLRGRLSSFHQQMLNLPGSRAEQWQALLRDYAVTASALYRTLETEASLQMEARKMNTVSSAANARRDASMSSIKNTR
jgi:hypothetical protein